MEIQELLIDLEFSEDLFTTEQNLRYESLVSNCPDDNRIVALVEWLKRTTFKNKKESYDSSLCKNRIKFE